MLGKRLAGSALAVALCLVALPAGAADPKTRRMSVKNSGGEVPQDSDGYIDGLSDDGKVAAFTSGGGLVAADDNGFDDIYVRDLDRGKTIWVTVGSNGISDGAAVSGNGRFVAFKSEADNLVANDDNEDPDIFVYNLATKKVKLVSRSANGNAVDQVGHQPAINRSGRFVAFETASQLVNKDNNHSTDVYLRDRKRGTTELVSVDSQGNDTVGGDSTDPSLSASGRFVAFDSGATDLVPNDENNYDDVFRHDRRTGKTIRLSRKNNGEEVDATSGNPSINADGTKVAFDSLGSLINLDDNDDQDVYLRNVSAGKTVLVSKNHEGEPADNDTYYAAISPDGRMVGFISFATDLIANPPPGVGSPYVVDRKSRKTRLLDRTNAGEPGSGSGYVMGLSNVFALIATTSPLVGSDDNDVYDVYRRGPLR